MVERARGVWVGVTAPKPRARGTHTNSPHNHTLPLLNPFPHFVRSTLSPPPHPSAPTFALWARHERANDELEEGKGGVVGGMRLWGEWVSRELVVPGPCGAAVATGQPSAPLVLQLTLNARPSLPLPSHCSGLRLHTTIRSPCATLGSLTLPSIRLRLTTTNLELSFLLRDF